MCVSLKITNNETSLLKIHGFFMLQDVLSFNSKQLFYYKTKKRKMNGCFSRVLYIYHYYLIHLNKLLQLIMEQPTMCLDVTISSLSYMLIAPRHQKRLENVALRHITQDCSMDTVNGFGQRFIYRKKA